MSGLPTGAEQVARLEALGCDRLITYDPHDVATLHLPDDYELVNVDGTYDVWLHGRLAVESLTLDDAKAFIRSLTESVT